MRLLRGWMVECPDAFPYSVPPRPEEQLRRLNPEIHAYGHSQVECQVEIDGVLYINNALGYSHETGMTARRLVCIYGGQLIAYLPCIPLLVRFADNGICS